MIMMFTVPFEYEVYFRWVPGPETARSFRKMFNRSRTIVRKFGGNARRR